MVCLVVEHCDKLGCVVLLRPDCRGSWPNRVDAGAPALRWPVSTKGSPGPGVRVTVSKSPFVEKAVRCPACGQESPQRFFRQRMFAADVKESDQHVASYRWLAQDFEQVHPPFYFLYLCPLCKFTDTADDFAKPPDMPAAAQVLKEYRNNGGNHALIQSLGRRIDYESIGFESALNMHLLALRIHSLPKDEDVQDAYKLARIYLRVAWLYREQNAAVLTSAGAEVAQQPAGEKAPQSTSKPMVDAIPEPPPEPMVDRAEIEATVLELHDGVEAMAACWSKLLIEWRATRQLLRKRIREITKSGMLDCPNPYPACFATMNQQIEQLDAELGRLKDLCARDASREFVKQGPAPPERATPAREGQKPPFQAVNQPISTSSCSHEAFLREVKAAWPETPLMEREATLSAIKYFRRALMADARFDNAENLLKVSTLVADLLIRCEDFSGSLEMVRSMYKSAVEERQQIQGRLRKKELSEADQRQLQNSMKHVTEALERAGDLRRDVLEMMVAHEMPKIRKIVQDSGAEGPALEQAFLSGGVFPEVVAELKKPGGLLAAGKRGFGSSPGRPVSRGTS